MASLEAELFVLRLVRDIFDPVRQAEHELARVEYERTRTDPWRWYCRICGATGNDEDRLMRDIAGLRHLQVCGGGRPVLASEESGRLAHVWSYWPFLGQL